MRVSTPNTSIGAARAWCLLSTSLVLAGCSLCSGCGDGVQGASPSQVAAFEKVGLAGPAIDWQGLVRARLDSPPYHVTTDEVLQIQIPRNLAVESSESETRMEGRETYACRVGEGGTIVLPLVGRLVVEGKSLTEIESVISAAYYPAYTRTQPSVYTSVLEYKTQKVSVVGAVAKPGVYPLRRDQMSLVALLAEAGGIVAQGAALISITRLDARATPGAQSRGSTERPTVGLQGSREPMPQIISPQAMAAAARSLPADPIAVKATFEQEGPLRTTGWLTLAGPDKTLGRTWLDLGNRSLRRAFLSTSVATSSPAEMTYVGTRLAQLADVLESGSQGGDMPQLVRGAGWQAEDGTHFVTSLVGTPALDQGASAQSAGARLSEVESHGRETILALPIKGLNIPFADVVLEEGDDIVVEWPQEQSVSVVGLVTRPGNMPYPRNAQYTLIQAIAFAGGLDLTADPRFISVYRLQSTGDIASITLRLVNPRKQEQLTQALALPLLPGDVVSVEHTPRTRTNVFLDRFFRISLGLYFSPQSIWNRE